ncbi:MAG TPA: RNA polymerase sigma factor [Chthonomonadaceae bacterium]|nr:RNA polymerase sigma factor [Chthonomonadaceae bacterium]
MSEGEGIRLAKMGTPTPYCALEEERRLVEAALGGDYSAFDTLVERHWRKVASVAGRLLQDANEAEDVVQETFIRAFESLKSFRGQAGFQTWLIRITINQCKNRRQTWWKRRVLLHEPDQTPTHIPSPEQGGETVVLQEEQAKAVQSAVRQLPEKYRLPIVLHYFEELTGAEIAAVLGWKESLVWSRIYSGYRELRKRLAAWQES